MYEFHPYYTNDGSVGLYSPAFNDIYHSASGALTEAIEKFVLPADVDSLMQKQTITVLDICCGSGYNTKSFLNYIYKNYFNNKRKFFIKNFLPEKILKKVSHAEINTAAIYTDKICSTKRLSKEMLSVYNEKIYTDNTFPDIYITAVDNDKILTYLSPFIKTGQKNFKNKNLDFEYKKIEKYLSQDKKTGLPKIDRIINFLILDKIVSICPDFLQNDDLRRIITSKHYAGFLDPVMTSLYKFYSNASYNLNHATANPLFLHNIYYRYISKRYKSRLKSTNLNKINYDLKTGDARFVIKEDKKEYNLIFLDAFTPSKCPCLWSYEFFKLLYTKLKPDGKLLTYSMAAPVRAAMIEAGFHIGELYIKRENKYAGTIAVKDKSLIKYPLSKFDLGLLNTTAGIFYRDKDLNAQNETISKLRELEVKNSTRMSSTHYRKLHKST